MEDRPTPSQDNRILKHRPRLTLISWCVQRKFPSKPFPQETFVERYEPDIVALQGVGAGFVPTFREICSQARQRHFLDSFSRYSPVSFPTSRTEAGTMIASRYPITALPPDHFPFPGAYRTVSAVVHTPGRDIVVHSVDVPKYGRKGLDKVETLEGIYERVTRDAPTPQILCGVFHLVKEETSTGEVITTAQGRRRKNGIAYIRPSRGPRSERAERNILLGLNKVRITEDPGYSTYSLSRNQRVGKRVDHVFASLSLCPVEATYVHLVRPYEFGNHFPMKVVFDFESHGEGL